MLKAAPITRPQTTRWETVRIFISSTFNDMHAERDYLVKQVFPELRDWCEKRKLRLLDIDLRWGVTEQDTKNQSVVKVCLECIDACRPFFLCFLGQRRGWVPTKKDISPETYAPYPDLEGYVEHASASVTELEILHALINPLHRGKVTQDDGQVTEYAPAYYSFFYLRQPDFLDELPSDIPHLRQIYTNEGSDDPGKDDAELRRWREEEIPKTHRPVHHYSTFWDIEKKTPEIRLPLACPSTAEHSSKVWQSTYERWSKQWKLAGVQVDAQGEISDAAERMKAEQYNGRLTQGRLTKFTCQDKGQSLADTILADLQAAIETRYPDHIERVDLTPLQRELDQQEQFFQVAGEGFIEREGDLADLDRYVEDTSQQPFFLTAPSGLGKTSLLAHWIERWQTSRRPSENLHYRFIGASDNSTTVDTMLRSVLNEIKEVTGKISTEIPTEPDKLRKELPTLLEETGLHGKTVLVLDGLNQLETELTDLAWLPLALPPGVKLITSFKRGEPHAEAYLEQLRAGGQAIVAEIKPFADLDNRRELVNVYLNKFLKKLDERHLEALIRSEGADNPLYLKVVLAELRVFGAFTDLGEKIRFDFGTTPVSAFTGVLRRLESDPAYSPVQPDLLLPHLFGWLAHARTGLTVEEMSGLLLREGLLPDDVKGRQQAAEAVHGLLRQVRLYLSRREGRSDFFYESFKLAVLERYVQQEKKSDGQAESRSAQAWHASLASYFDAQPLRLGVEQKPNRHKLVELAYQQTQGALWADLECTLCDLHFVEAKCAVGGTFDLVADYSAALRVLPEALEEQRSELKQVQRMSKYVEDLVAFARGEVTSLDVVRSIPLWDEERIRCEERRIAEAPTRLDRIRAFAQFVSRESHNLMSFGAERRFCVQQAFNAAPSGPLVDAASVILKGEAERVLLLHHPVYHPADLPYPALVRTLEGHSEWIGAVAITPDGCRALSRTRQSRVDMKPEATTFVWNLESGECVRRLGTGKGRVTAIALTPDGRRALLGGDDGALRIWEVDSGICLRTDLVHEHALTALAISADGRRAIVGLAPPPRQSLSSEARREVVIWDLEAGKHLRTLEAKADTEAQVAISADGRRAVTLDGKSVQVWDLESGACLHTLLGHIGPVQSVSISPDGLRAISGPGTTGLTVRDRERAIHVWNLETGECVQVLQGSFVSGNIEVSITPDGKRALSGGISDDLKVWHLDMGECQKTFRRVGPIHCLAISAEGRRAITASGQVIHVWDLERGANADLATVEAADSRHATQDVGWNDAALVWDQENTAVTPDGMRAALVGGEANTFLETWDLAGGIRTSSMKSQTGSTLRSVAVTPCGTRALAGSIDSSVQLYDLEADRCAQLERRHFGQVASVCISPDGRTAVSAPDEESGKPLDRTLWVWDLGTGKAITPVSLIWDGAISVRITADGCCALSGGRVDSLRLWNLRTGKSVRELEGHPRWAFRCVRITPDGKYAVSAASDGLRLWDLREGTLLRMFPDSAEHLSITPDSRYLVAVGGVVAIWDLNRGERIAVYAGPGNGGVIVPAEGSSPHAGVAVGPGALDFLTAFNLRPGPAIVTPVRLWLQAERAWDQQETVACPWCGRRFPVAQSVLKTIRAIALSAGLTPEQTPCLELPLAAWDEVRLSFDCPGCGRSLRSNPFVVDNRSPEQVRHVAAAPTRSPTYAEITPTLAPQAVPQPGTEAGHAQQVVGLALAAGGATAAAGLADGRIRIIDLETGAVRYDLVGHSNPVHALAFSADGSQLVTTSKGEVGVWNLGSGDLMRWVFTGPGSAVLTRDGSKVVCISGGDTIQIRSTVHPGPPQQLKLKGSQIRAFATDAGANRLAAGCGDGRLLFVDLRKAAVTATVRCQTPVLALALDANGKLAFYAAGDRTIRVWDMLRKTELRSLPWEVSPILAMAASADGKWLVSITQLTLSVFDVMRATRVRLQTDPRGWSACAVSGDGLLAAGGGPAGRVETFRVRR